jgi:asparaginyl-tRNA synthetase
VKATSVADVLKERVDVGSEILLQGWVRTRRTSKAGITFIELNDGSSLLGVQIVVPESAANYDSEIVKLSAGCAIEAKGIVVASEGSGQSLEIQSSDVVVHGWVEDPETYPIAKKRHTFEYLRSQAHLRPRTNAIGAVTRLRNTVANAIHNYFYQEGFCWINTPLITSSDCEGAGEMFRVSTLDLANLPRNDKGGIDFSKDFFASESFLTVSGQLNLEAYCLAMSKVYTFGPTFRAENSHTSRHLAEFWMVEPEVAFNDLQANAELAEDFIKHILRAVMRDRADDMAFFEQRIDDQAIKRIENVIDTPFTHMDYTDAVNILTKCGKDFEFPVKWGIDLQSEHERFLAEEYVKGPVVVKNYPKDIKAFYMRLNDDEKTVAAMDVLAPGIGEIIGGSQREERLDVLDSRINAHMRDELWWYRDLRRYGTVPHAGFGMGFERILNYISGMENIRDVIPFPRVAQHMQF